ncbi:unnamed protein product [Arctogadus glacialis]
MCQEQQTVTHGVKGKSKDEEMRVNDDEIREHEPADYGRSRLGSEVELDRERAVLSSSEELTHLLRKHGKIVVMDQPDHPSVLEEASPRHMEDLTFQVWRCKPGQWWPAKRSLSPLHRGSTVPSNRLPLSSARTALSEKEGRDGGEEVERLGK